MSQDLKYARGGAPRAAPSQRPVRPLEWVALWHAGLLLIATTWAFGGQADFLQLPLSWWGSLGLLVTLTALQDREARREGWLRPLRWLWPLLAFDGLVVAACFNPSLREMTSGSESMLAHTGERPHLPSSARPELALKALWLFNALWIPCFNLALIVRQRRLIRGLLIVVALNGAALAIFGTLQKLAHARGLFFDAVPSPQPFFFASFIYHNHWGAFTVLMLAICLGLVWHYARRREARNVYHSPAWLGLAAVLLLTITIPFSGSRSSTLLALLLLGGAGVHFCLRLIQKRRRFRESIVLPLAGGSVALLLAVGVIWWIARDSIVARVDKTREQVEQIRARGSMGSRVELYRDTWQMAQAKPWFGWGMASFPHVFMMYNQQESKVDRLPVFYRDAHSDWLQALAEHGYLGSALLALTAALPLLRLRRRHFSSPLPVYLLSTCGLILAYAGLEFPFANKAVVVTWWLCFFCAVQYARLQDRETPAPIIKKTPPPVFLR